MVKLQTFLTVKVCMAVETRANCKLQFTVLSHGGQTSCASMSQLSAKFIFHWSIGFTTVESIAHYMSSSCKESAETVRTEEMSVHLVDAIKSSQFGQKNFQCNKQLGTCSSPDFNLGFASDWSGWFCSYSCSSSHNPRILIKFAVKGRKLFILKFLLTS